MAYHRWRQKALDVELSSAEARSKTEEMKTFIASCKNQSDLRAITGCDGLDVPRQVGRLPESLDAFEQETTGLAEAGDTPADLVYWKIDIENFIRSRRAAAVITTAVIIILQPNLGLPRWHGSPDSSLMFFNEGRSQLPTSGDLMAAFMGATIMVLAGVMLWKRWRRTKPSRPTSSCSHAGCLPHPVRRRTEENLHGCFDLPLLCAPMTTRILVNRPRPEVHPATNPSHGQRRTPGGSEPRLVICPCRNLSQAMPAGTRPPPSGDKTTLAVSKPAGDNVAAGDDPPSDQMASRCSSCS